MPRKPSDGWDDYVHGHSLHILATPFSPTLRTLCTIFAYYRLWRCMGTLNTSLQHPFLLLCDSMQSFAYSLHILCTLYVHSLHTLGAFLAQFINTFLTHSFIFITMQWETVVNKRIRSDRFSASLLVISTGWTDFICAYNNQWGVRKLRPYRLTNLSNV